MTLFWGKKILQRNEEGKKYPAEHLEGEKISCPPDCWKKNSWWPEITHPPPSRVKWSAPYYFKHNTVEPRFNEVPRDWRNLFVKSLNSLYRTPPFKRGTLGLTQYRNTVRKNGKYRNTRWKIVEISIPHILITFIIDSTYLRLLPSSAFNYLRHLCTRCLFSW